MEEWIRCNIGDVCDTISDTYRGDADKVVLVNTSDVLDGKCLNHQKSPNKDLKGQFKKTFQRDDILYSEIRPANKRFAYIDFDGTDYIASTKLMVIRHKENIIPQFLYYIITSQAVIEELQMLAESRSGTFPQITFTELANQSIELPPLPEQGKIVRFLKSLDDKIKVNKRINDNFFEVMLIWFLISLENDNLEQQAQALFKSWLSDCHEEVTIGQLSQNITDYTKCELPKVILINSSDVTEGHFEHHNFSENRNLKGHFKKRFQKGDILYSQVRPRNRHWGYCTFDADAYLASTQLMVIRNKADVIPSILLYQYIIDDDVWMDFTNKTETRSGTFPQGNYEELSSIKVRYGADMSYISNKLKSIYTFIFNNEDESRRLASLRDILLPRLMSGELKVNEIENVI